MCVIYYSFLVVEFGGFTKTPELFLLGVQVNLYPVSCISKILLDEGYSLKLVCFGLVVGQLFSSDLITHVRLTTLFSLPKGFSQQRPFL